MGILLLVILVLLLTIKKLRTRHKNQLNQLDAQHRKEVQSVKIRVREETLNYIASEIHDHIGQLLAVVKMNLALQQDPKLNEARELISRIIKDIREIVHAMNAEQVTHHDLAESIEKEIQRLRNSCNYHIDFRPHGKPFLMNAKTQAGVFRIFQECISNIIKHADAKNIAVELYFEEKLFTLVIRDDGRGFEAPAAGHGLGLQNMEYRAQLLGGTLELNTSPGTGCSVTLTIIP